MVTGFGAWENIMNARCQEVKRMQVGVLTACWDTCGQCGRLVLVYVLYNCSCAL